MFGRQKTKWIPDNYFSKGDIEDAYFRLFPERKQVPMHGIDVEGPEDAWAVLTWALSKGAAEYSAMGASWWKTVRVSQHGITGAAIRFDDPTRGQRYTVEFPQSIWDREKAGHTDAYAERKVREDIFGKGKH